MKTELLITHLTAVGPPSRAEYENFEVIMDVFRPIQAVFVVGRGATVWFANPLLSPKYLSEDHLITLLRRRQATAKTRDEFFLLQHPVLDTK